MSPPEQLKKQLYGFAANIRDPENQPAPAGIEDRRMEIYRGLFFNNINGFLSNTFPVLRSLYDEDDWEQLVRAFFTGHRCQTPYFLEISREFLDYLQSAHVMREVDPPFLFELAHYEWVELALSISSEEINEDDIDKEGSLLDGHPVISPRAWVLTYAYPVHMISPGYRPEAPADTPSCIIVYLDDDDEVQFTEINPVTAKLLQQLEANPDVSSRDVLLEIAGEIGYDEAEKILPPGEEILEGLRQKGVILGVQRM